METAKILSILERNIDQYWRELEMSEFDLLLIKLEKHELLSTADRQSLLLRLGRKKIREGAVDNPSPSLSLEWDKNHVFSMIFPMTLPIHVVREYVELSGMEVL